MAPSQRNVRFALCIDRRGAEDLEQGKVYQVLPDVTAEKDGLIRVIDDSAEDFLYPKDCFVPLDLPTEAKRALLAGRRRAAVDTKRLR